MFPTSRTAGGLNGLTWVTLTAETGTWLHREFPSCELMSLLLPRPVGMLLSSAFLHLESASMPFADMPKRDDYIFVIWGYFWLSVVSYVLMENQGYITSINHCFLTPKRKWWGIVGTQWAWAAKIGFWDFSHTVPSPTVTFVPSTKILTATMQWGLQCNRKNTGVREFKPHFHCSFGQDSTTRWVSVVFFNL